MMDLTQASSHSASFEARSAQVEQAFHATQLGGEAPEWVQLLPASPFTGRDGRGPFVYDADAVIDETREVSGGADLPIDYGHALDLGGHEGDAAPAAAWITEMQARSDGLWGRVSWTDEGARRVTGREFRFLSPVFYHAKQGEKRVRFITGAGLTNRPNLIMKAVNSHSHQEDGVTDFLKRVSAALGLGDGADEGAVLVACSGLSAARADLVKVAQSVDLTESATGDEMVAAVQARATPDPAKFIPIEQFQKVSSALQAAQTKEGEALVDQLQRDGKLIPAQREWALAYHAKDPEAFAAFAASLPVVVAAGAEGGKRKTPEQRGALDDEAKAVCAMLGIEEAEYTKNLEN